MRLTDANVLVVDDDPDVLLAVKMLLRPEVRQIETEKNPERLRSILSKNRFDIILLDMNYHSSIQTGNEGFYWLKQIQQMAPQTAVVMITAYGDIDIAVRSLKEGAADFVLKPWRNERLLATLEEISLSGKFKHDKTRKPAPLTGPSLTILGESDAMQEVFYKIDKIAPTDANVLILGENGTGKELIARAIHQKSLRASQPFVGVDLGAITDSLFESELFGHRRGAFTDAKEDRVGRFEVANGGTLFLDEIGNISLPQQAKLLSVLQNRQVFRVGASQPIPIDIRLLSATNAPIHELASEAKFRKDLVYRLNTVEITLPPLRQRGNDVVVLARYFAELYAEKYRKPTPHFDEKAIQKLKNHAFPGNVRELQYCVERAVIMAETELITAADLLFSAIENNKILPTEPEHFRLDDVEKSTILKVIEKHSGNISKAARELGITRSALYRRLGKYDL
jgi:two-component system, NtrC family, response regulator HydG